MNFQKLLGIQRFHYFIIFTTNRCNLHCERCITWCHKPLNPTSEQEILRTKYEIPLRDIEQFCERFKGYGENEITRLTGGEPTTLPKEKLEEIVEILNSYNRKIWMITNGYGLLNIGDATLRKIDGFILDDHTINHSHILACKRHLTKLNVANVKHLKTPKHADYIFASENKAVQRDCRIYMRTPILYKRVIYPCCAIPFIEQLTVSDATEQLREVGWTLGNPDVAELFSDWRQKLPPEPRRLCLTRCWRPHYRAFRTIPITLKPHDVIHA